MPRRTATTGAPSAIRILASTWCLSLLLVGCGPADQEPTPATDDPAADGVSQTPDTPVPGSETGDPLAGTEWQLVEIQSMDDAIGTTSPDEPSVYTLTLNADGTAAMLLDCNRGSGSWSATPSEDGQSGSIEFGPMAVTRALCPPPSLGEQLAAQLPYVRSYLLRDGRLNLSLMADGGILVWEPVSGDGPDPEDPPTDADPVLESAILEAAPDYTIEAVGTGDDRRPARYVYERTDLNEDGAEEVFVYPMCSIFCGSGGCDLMLFTREGDGYRLVNSFAISRTPVIVSPTRTSGWNDIIRLESGGGAAASRVRHSFDGERYVQGERTSGGETPEGRQILSGDVTFDAGILLEPRR